MNVTGNTLVFGLLGHPVRHSLSPAMHTRLFAQVGVDAVYVAFDVHPGRAARLGDAVRTLDLRGANLTVPFKGAILPQLDHVTRAAEEAQAANVVIQHGGHLTGYNTDGEGFCRGYEEAFGPIPAGTCAVVLGAGGAGRAIAAALADRGAARVVLLNRRVERARDAASHLRTYFPQTLFEAGPLAPESFARHAPDASVVVNCTSGAGADTVEALPVEGLREDATWCDVNYWMPRPPRLAACRERGLRVQDGLPMLVHQGALSFELFTGLPVDPLLIRAHLR